MEYNWTKMDIRSELQALLLFLSLLASFHVLPYHVVLLFKRNGLV